MNKYDEMLKKIQEKRKEALILIKNGITGNNKNVLDNIDNIISTFNEDEKNLKQFKAIITAKEMIVKLTIQVCNAKTNEEIEKVRKSLNYYMDKVKKEFIKRNISEDKFNEYYRSMRCLKGDITELVRVKKRETNLSTINTTIKTTNMSKEDLEVLRKSFQNENRFNNRILNKYSLPIEERTPVCHYTKQKKDQVQITNQINTSRDKRMQLSDEIISEIRKGTHQNEKTSGVGFLLTPQDIAVMNMKKELAGENIFEREHAIPNLAIPNWQEQIKQIYPRYDIWRPVPYENGTKGNIKILFFNIPKYLHNRKTLKLMRKDYYHCRIEALKRLIDYTEYNNSIRLAVKRILVNTKLSKDEQQCLSKQEKYLEDTYNALYAERQYVKVA